MSETKTLFATAATADRPDAKIAVIWFATHPPDDYALTVLDFQQYEMPTVNADWVAEFVGRSAQLIGENKPAKRECFLRVEHPGLIDVLKRADAAYRDTKAGEAIDRSVYDIRPIKDYEGAKWPATFDERASLIRPLVNSGRAVKLDTGLRRFWPGGTNHLVSQLRAHRPGDLASAGELLHAFVLGVLLGTTPRSSSWFERPLGNPPKSTPSAGPFGSTYFPGRRPL